MKNRRIINFFIKTPLVDSFLPKWPVLHAFNSKHLPDGLFKKYDKKNAPGRLVNTDLMKIITCGTLFIKKIIIINIRTA